MPVSNQSETIDPRILRLIGLEDVFDLDYETYLTLLKEAMVKSRMTKKTIPTEEVMLLTEEFKRVKSKKDKGRFNVKKKKISADSFGVSSTTKKIAVTAPKMLPPVGGVKGGAITKATTNKITKSSTGALDNNVLAIKEAIVSVVDTLKAQKKADKDKVEYNRKKAEREKRGLAEFKLENAFKGLLKTAEKIISPVKSLFDRMFEFIKTVILGRIVYKIVEWMGDKKNAGKLKSIIRFIKDWWPVLLGSYVLFGTTFGKFIRGTIGLLTRFIFQIGKVAIPQLLRFIKSPLGIGVGLFTAGATIPMLFPQTVDEQERKTAKAPGTTADKIKSLQQQKANLNFFEKLQGKGAEIDEQISFLQTGKTKSYGFKGGGFVNGFVSGEKGVDKVPAMLSDGEFVMSRGAVQKYGVDTLEAMNSAGGGTNRPKIMSGTTYAAGGGMIGSSPSLKKDQPPSKGLRPRLQETVNFIKSVNNYAKQQIISGGNNNLIKSLNNLTNALKGSVSGVASGTSRMASNLYNVGVGQATKAQNYLQGGGLQKDVSKLMQSGTQYGAGLYDQAMKVGNKALSDIQSGKIQNQILKTGKGIAETPKKAAGGFFDFMGNVTSSKGYKENAARMDKMQDKVISLGDSFIKKLPDGPFREMADKGLIPIPSGNATMMRNLTFAKALLGPLGRPFKILSNKEVDAMRQKTIEKTMGKSGLSVDPKTGQVKMNWNQEDINKGAKGGGAYTDDLGKRGAAFNSILGRFSASTEGKGNTLYSDDRYNFNRTAAEYAKLAKQGLMKGSISDATYFGASMLGRFAQDIGWLNQRALGSRIKIGEVNRNQIDPKTGKGKTPQQMAAEQAKRAQIAKSKPKSLPVKPPQKSTVIMQGQSAVTMYSKNDSRRKSSARPTTPKFSASNPAAGNAKVKTLGVR